MIYEIIEIWRDLMKNPVEDKQPLYLKAVGWFVFIYIGYSILSKTP